jgi:hypothetical protein
MTHSSFGPSVTRLWLAAALAAGLAAPALAGTAQDDLQAVKRAVLAQNAARARPPVEDPATVRRETLHERGKAAAWFRVRIVEKGGRRGRVSVNLPIGFVRTLGDEWPIPSYHGCRKRDRCGATLGEILRALDGGQSLVEIEDDEASVRVWID